MKNNPTRILLIAGYFPPIRISTGSIRIWNVAWILNKLGWDVTVLTPKVDVWDPRHIDQKEKYLSLIGSSGIDVVYTQHWFKFLAPTRYGLPKNKISWFFGGIFRKTARWLGISDWFGWIPASFMLLPKLKLKGFDLILATGAPFYGFIIASIFSKMLGIPFIIDYRDLWTNNPWYPINQKWVAKLEKTLINHSAAVTVVSPLSGRMLVEKFGSESKVNIITNGYESELLNNIPLIVMDQKFIVFAGMLFPPKLTLQPIFDVVQKYQAELESQNIKFIYYGPNYDLVQRECNQLGISEFWEIHDQIERHRILKLEKAALFNIILSSNLKDPTVEELGVIPGKVFELVGLNASLLPIVPIGSSVEEILVGMGVKTFDPSNTDAIYQFIRNEKQNIARGHEVYAWENLALKFDELFTRTIGDCQ